MDTILFKSSRQSIVILVLLASLLFNAPIAAQQNSNVVFDAKGGYALVPHADALNLAPRLTLEVWIRPSPLDIAHGAVLSKDYANGFTFGVLSLPGRTDSVDVAYACAGDWLYGPRIPCDSLTWTHVALTVDSVAQVAVFYVNGIAAGTVTGSTVKIRNNTADMYIGSSQYNDTFRGALNEVRIWNVVRSAFDIDALWNREAKGNEPGIVAVYHFEDDRDTLAWNRAASGGLHGNLNTNHHFYSVTWSNGFTDEDEPNGQFASATVASYGSAILNATIAPGDTDIYKVWSWPGDIVRIQSMAKNTGDQGDMSISVYGPDSVTHITTYISGYPSFNTAASVPGYRYIRVANRSGAGGAYKLVVTRQHATLQADQFEPNNSPAQATPLIWGTVNHVTLFPGLDAGIAVPDTDYYAFEAQAGEIGFFIHALQGFSCGSGFPAVIGSSGVLPKTFPNTYQNVKFTSSGTYLLRIRPNEAAYEYLVAGFKGLEDIHGMLYDVGTYGDAVQLCDGMYNAYDYAYRLKINSQIFTAEPDYSLADLDGRQFVFGPATYSGLSVSRKFFVPSAAQGDTLGFMRIQDILTNSTAAPNTVNVGVWSNFGAYPAQKIATSSGDTLFTLDDTWLWTDDTYPSSGKPNLLHIFDGVGGSDRVDSIRLALDVLYWEWKNVTVQPGETKIYLYYVAQDSLPENAQKKGPAFSGSVLPPAAILGLGADAAKVMNWPLSALVSVEQAEPRPMTFSLSQNYPNPFNPTTTIEYNIGGVVALSGAHLSGVEGRATANVRLAVYDLLGREVAVLVNEQQDAGTHTVTFDARGFASGVYFCRIRVRPLDSATGRNSRSGAGEFVQTRKLLLMR